MSTATRRMGVAGNGAGAREVRVAGLWQQKPAPLEVRFAEGVKRDADGGAGAGGGAGGKAPIITGYAAVFDAETVLYEASGQYPEVREVVRRGAFARAIRENQDVAAVIEHEWGRVIARTPSTLQLSEDEIGLRVVASPPATREALDLAANIQAGNIRGMSFRFYPVETKEHTKVEERTMPDGKVRGVRVVLRELIDLDFSDVSWCVWPAYDATSAGTQMRSAMLGDLRSDPFAPGGALSWAGDAVLRQRANSLRAAMLVDAAR
jgi:uncharacterized protein